MSLRKMLSDYWYAFQQELFPRLEGELGPMGERYELFVRGTSRTTPTGLPNSTWDEHEANPPKTPQHLR